MFSMMTAATNNRLTDGDSLPQREQCCEQVSRVLDAAVLSCVGKKILARREIPVGGDRLKLQPQGH
jgi:hypothetical protein